MKTLLILFTTLALLINTKCADDQNTTPDTVYTKGDKGDKGEKGDIGPKGDKGDQGLPGKNGIDGKDGSNGKDGAKGDTGDRGPQGIQGPVGPKGSDGKDGAVGATGGKGDQGERGPIGLTGPIGPKGEKGDVGPAGAKGDKGDTGPQGPRGIKGDKGDKGDRGFDGMSIVYKEDVQPKNVDCTGSWVTVTYGNDLDGDSEMQESEKRGLFNFCADLEGYELVTHSEYTTENCPNGGNIIYFAEDRNKDGIFSTGDKFVNKVTVCRQ